MLVVESSPNVRKNKELTTFTTFLYIIKLKFQIYVCITFLEHHLQVCI